MDHSAVSRANIQVALLAIMVCALAGAAVITLNAGESHKPGNALVLGDLLVGETTNHPVVVRLANGRVSSQIRKVVSTCGCAQLTGYRPVEGDLNSLALVLTTLPNSYDKGIGSRILITYEDGTVDETSLAGEIVPPVSGWPSSFSYTLDGNRLFVALDKRYRDLLFASEMFWGDDLELETRFDRATGRIEVILPETLPSVDSLDLLLSFGDSQKTVTWVGITKNVPQFRDGAGQ